MFESLISLLFQAMAFIYFFFQPFLLVYLVIPIGLNCFLRCIVYSFNKDDADCNTVVDFVKIKKTNIIFYLIKLVDYRFQTFFNHTIYNNMSKIRFINYLGMERSILDLLGSLFNTCRNKFWYVYNDNK